MTKNVLVTGGAGFVGSHLVDALLNAGHKVRVLDNLTPQVHSNRIPEYLSPEAELVIGNLCDEAAVRGALDGIEVIFHLAAVVGVGQSMYEISRYVEVNTLGTAVLLQEMLNRRNKIEKLVLASSMSIYGEGKYVCTACGEKAPPLRPAEQLRTKQWETLCPECAAALAPAATPESKPLQCSSIYALSKKDQEEMCLLYGRTYNLPVVALRYFNIYGARQALSNPYTGVAAIFASRLLNGKPPLVFEDGKQVRDFVSVDDVVQANLLAMERSLADGMALNIGSGEPISIGEVALTLSAALETPIPAEFTGKYRAGDIRHCFADISGAQKLLGYQPRFTFSEGVRDLVAWLRSQQPADRAAEATAQLNYYGLTA
ncbi:MAG TPA: NAD-dependent epimerase/dehydratase family protein [Candidatus Angelobacter sp.]